MRSVCPLSMMMSLIVVLFVARGISKLVTRRQYISHYNQRDLLIPYLIGVPELGAVAVERA